MVSGNAVYFKNRSKGLQYLRGRRLSAEKYSRARRRLPRRETRVLRRYRGGEEKMQGTPMTEERVGKRLFADGTTHKKQRNSTGNRSTILKGSKPHNFPEIHHRCPHTPLQQKKRKEGIRYFTRKKRKGPKPRLLLSIAGTADKGHRTSYRGGEGGVNLFGPMGGGVYRTAVLFPD